MGKRFRTITQTQDPAYLQNKIKTLYMNKYFNLFMNLFEWEGIDKEQRHYLMKKLWCDGTIAAFKIKNLDEIGFCPYAATAWNMYDFAEKVSLINERGVPFIPNTEQVVEKDVVIGFIQHNHKSIKQMAEYWIDRMVQIDMVINTNLELQKMPFIVKCDAADVDKMKDIINRILNNEIAVFTDLEAAQLAESINTNTPYIIDKLYAARVKNENELLSFLGIDNTGNAAKATTETLDEVNANNVLINLGQDEFLTNLQEFTDSVQEVLGVTISAKMKADRAEETAESRNKADAENAQEEEVEEDGQD